MADFEICSRVERRRKWTAGEKSALLAEIEAEGGRVSVVARRHQIAESVLYGWRAALRAACELSAVEPVTFVPLGIVGPRPADDHAPPSSDRHPDRLGLIEIELPNGARVRVDASVNDKALSRVFRAMKGIV
jgi:transposase